MVRIEIWGITLILTQFNDPGCFFIGEGGG